MGNPTSWLIFFAGLTLVGMLLTGLVVAIIWQLKSMTKQIQNNASSRSQSRQTDPFNDSETSIAKSPQNFAQLIAILLSTLLFAIAGVVSALLFRDFEFAWQQGLMIGSVVGLVVGLLVSGTWLMILNSKKN